MIQFSAAGKTFVFRFGFSMSLLCLVLISGDRFWPSFCFCMLHECGHLAMCRVLGFSAYRLEFGCTGLTLHIDGISECSLSKQRLLHAGGILSNFLVAWLLGILSHWVPTMREWAFINAALACFHAIPAKNLDGGQLWMLFAEGWMEPEHLYGWEWMGQIIAFALFIGLAAAAFSIGQIKLAVGAAWFALCCIMA